MQTIRPYTLLPKQKEFARSTATFRLYGGASGGGKSYAMRYECVRQSVATAPYPVNGLVLRRTMPEVKANMIRPLEDELPRGSYVMNHSDNIMTFYNGSMITFGYCEGLPDLKRYQGVEFDWICIEELTHWTEEEFRLLMRSLRSKKPGWKPNFFASTNPGGIGHAWVKRLWVNRSFNLHENPADYSFISAKVYDNHVLLENDPAYVKRLEALPEKDRRAYLDGDWDVFEGQYFEDFRHDLHVSTAFLPVGIKRRIIAIDYGRVAPACALWIALDNQNHVYVYRELYRTGMTYDQFATSIAALTPEGEDISHMVCDPAALEKQSDDTTNTLHGAFRRAELPRCYAANNSRIDGWNTIRRYLQTEIREETGRMRSALTIFEHCRNLIRTLPEMIHDVHAVEDLNTHGEDHAVDALRYGLMDLSVNVTSLADVNGLNEMLTKSYAYGGLTPKEREFRRRGISDSRSFLDMKF